MSYVGPDFEPPQPRRRRGPLTVALAALVPGALLGWLVYATVGGSGDDRGDRAPVARNTAAPHRQESRDPDAEYLFCGE